MGMILDFFSLEFDAGFKKVSVDIFHSIFYRPNNIMKYIYRFLNFKPFHAFLELTSQA